MTNKKNTDPEIIKAGEDLNRMSNLSNRVISNDEDLFEELGTIQRKLCDISILKADFLKRYEDILAICIFTIMALLPSLETITRIFGILSVPASQVLVQHLTLWIGFIGAILATRQNKLLALTHKPLFMTDENFHLGRYIAKLLTFLVLIVLAWGSWKLLKIEME